MRAVRQLLLMMTLSGGMAAPAVLGAEYPVVEVQRSLFGEELGIAEQQRDDFAENLAVLAGNGVVKDGKTQKALDRAARYLSVALQLNPRNRRAVLTNHKLKRGVELKKLRPDYTPSVFAGLLHSVGKSLLAKGDEKNLQMAGAFLALAAELDPENEDFVFDQQLYEIDHGKLDWEQFKKQAPIQRSSASGS